MPIVECEMQGDAAIPVLASVFTDYGIATIQHGPLHAQIGVALHRISTQTFTGRDSNFQLAKRCWTMTVGLRFPQTVETALGLGEIEPEAVPAMAILHCPPERWRCMSPNDNRRMGLL